MHLPSELKERIQEKRQGVCLITEVSNDSTLSTGSGFLINARLGHVLTNQHVISKGHRHLHDFPYASSEEKRFEAEVITSGGQEYSNRIMSDWALLRLQNYKPDTIRIRSDLCDSRQEPDDIVLDEVVTLGFPKISPLNAPAFRSAIGRVEGLHVLYDMEVELS